MSWRDELKAEIEDTLMSLANKFLADERGDDQDKGKHFLELSALLRELIDHIPEEQEEEITEWPENTTVVQGYSGFSGYKGIYGDTEEPK